MSKVDAMRALREARQAAASKGAPATAPRASTQARPAPRKEAAAPVEAPTGLCGHRNMGGKSCTRDADHVQQGT
ncbi:MAG: hypothetical protein JWM62_3242, partial [Frankiales bacterium]|nr:hypothetical protein [Frankiales bacterium]